MLLILWRLKWLTGLNRDSNEYRRASSESRQQRIGNEFETSSAGRTGCEGRGSPPVSPEPRRTWLFSQRSSTRPSSSRPNRHRGRPIACPRPPEGRTKRAKHPRLDTLTHIGDHQCTIRCLALHHRVRMLVKQMMKTFRCVSDPPTVRFTSGRCIILVKPHAVSDESTEIVPTSHASPKEFFV